MELSNAISNDLFNNNEITIQQNDFLKSTLGKVINTGLNLGIRALLPDFVEDQVIEIKDALLNNGFKSGVKKAIEKATDLGKSAIGVVTGNFESISQAQNAIKNGGLIDSVSGLLNNAVDITVQKNMIKPSVGKMIKNGKNVILSTIENNIENSFFSQMSSLEKVNKYTENWKQFYSKQDFAKMDKEYIKIKNELRNVLPTENILKKAREIENLHLLIKNKGKDFNLTETEHELAKKLVQ